MEKKQFLYDAFISYRHTEPDKYIAETLHKRMESFKLPGNINRDIVKREKIERVFRDKEELPLASNLEDPIVDALANSEYLIVICSPRLKESMWCKKEIQTFIEMHGRRNILAVLAEGEPSDSFPEELLRSETGEPIEPLAADFRGGSRQEINKAMKSEIMRLLAPMFGVGYDDLRQRHREQHMKKMAAICAGVAALGIAFGIYSSATAIKINNQAKQLAGYQATSLAKKAEELREAGDRLSSIKTAYAALTSYEGIDMPYTPEAEIALVNCLNVYDSTSLVRPIDQIKLDGIANKMKVSPGNELVLTSDNLGKLYIISIPERKMLLDIETQDMYDGEYGFIDDENFYYIAIREGFVKVNISDGSKTVLKTNELEYISAACVSGDGKHILVAAPNRYDIINAKDMTVEHQYDDFEKIPFGSRLYYDEPTDSFLVETEKKGKAYIVSLSCDSGEVLFESLIPYSDVDVIAADKDTIYTLSTTFANNILGSSMIAGIDRKTGEKKIDVEYPGFLPSKIVFSDGKTMMVAASQRAKIIDKATGKEISEFTFSDSIAYAKSREADKYVFYTADGMCHMIDLSNEIDDVNFGYIDCEEVSQLELCEQGFAAIRNNDNRVLIFGIMSNIDAVVTTEDNVKERVDGLYDSIAREFCEGRGIERAAFAEACVSAPDADLFVVSYYDNHLEVYKNSTMELLYEKEDFPSGGMYYHGKAGEYYVFEIAYAGYLIGSDGQIRAQIPNIKGVTLDGTSVVVYGKDAELKSGLIAIPAYNTKQLLEKTKRNIDLMEERNAQK